MKFAMSLVAVAGIAVAANAAQTTMVWDVSVNGGPFAASASAVGGDTLTYRLRVSYSATSGTGATIASGGGLAGFNFLPTLSNFNGTALPLAAETFATGSANNPVPLTLVNHPDLGPVNVYTGTLPIVGRHGGGAIAPSTGRVAPFGANGTNTNGVASPSVEAGTLVWRAAVIANAGVSIAQLNAGNSNVIVPVINDGGTPGDTTDDFVDFAGNGGSFANSSRSNVMVFSYSVIAGAGDYTMVGSSSTLTPVQWYTSAAGASSSHTGAAVTTTDATVTVTPAPGALALLGLGGLLVSRRRR